MLAHMHACMHAHTHTDTHTHTPTENSSNPVMHEIIFADITILKHKNERTDSGSHLSGGQEMKPKEIFCIQSDWTDLFSHLRTAAWFS